MMIMFQGRAIPNPCDGTVGNNVVFNYETLPQVMLFTRIKFNWKIPAVQINTVIIACIAGLVRISF